MNTDIRILMIGPVVRTGGVATHTKELTTALKHIGVNIILYNSSFEGNYSRLIVNAVKIYNRTFRQFYFSIKLRNAYDLIHVQASGGLAGFLNAIIGSIVARYLRKPLVVTFHHSNTRKFVDKYKFLVGTVIKLSSKLILVSSNQKNVFCEYYPNFKMLQVIPNGYNSFKFMPKDIDYARKKLNIPKDVSVLVNIANLEEYKGQKYLIEAMKIILTTRQDVMLYIVGKGSQKDSLRSMINQLGLQKYVILAGGNKPPEEIPLWLNACDIFVLPSLSEGNPTVMFEALGCGRPFVGTRVGGVPEVIVDDRLGILVEPGDPEALAQAILQALEREWDHDYIRAYAQQFTWEKIAEQVVRVYEEVMRK